MLAASAWTTIARTSTRYPWLLLDCFVGYSLALALVLGCTWAFVRDREFMTRIPSFLPFAGIMLGNSLSVS